LFVQEPQRHGINKYVKHNEGYQHAQPSEKQKSIAAISPGDLATKRQKENRDNE
jgi:hypothetical protein